VTSTRLAKMAPTRAPPATQVGWVTQPVGSPRTSGRTTGKSCECETDGGVYAFDAPMPSANPCEACRCAASPIANCTPIPGCIADAAAE